MVEVNPYARAVLNKNFPSVPILGDIREITADDVRRVLGDQRITLLSGGYPCQPFSCAGQRKGTDDERHLWPYMYRLICDLRPIWVLGENVKGHLTIGVDEVRLDLERAGYEVGVFVYPASAVGATHKRERVFVVGRLKPVESSTGCQRRTGAKVYGAIRTVSQDEREFYNAGGSSTAHTGVGLANTTGELISRGGLAWSGRIGSANSGEVVGHTDEPRLQGRGGLHERTDQCTSRTRSAPLQSRGESEPRLGRTGLNELSARLDGYRWASRPAEAQQEWEPLRLAKGIRNRCARLKALGNAVVPAQVEPILWVIAEYERTVGNT